MKIPILTKKKLNSIGIYRKLTDKQLKRLKEGSKHELEHLKQGDDPLISVKIAHDHLKENPKYYTILKKSGL